MFGAVNPALIGKDFEIITWTHYPAHGNLNEGPLGFRLGSAAEMSFSHDFHRSINGFEGLMELQPGQVNWGDVNPQPYPGAVHLWIMRAFAADAKIVCTYRYREPLSGAEQYHYGLVGTDGVTPTTGGEQYPAGRAGNRAAPHEFQARRQRAGRLRCAPHRVALQRRKPLGHRQPQANRTLGHDGALPEIIIAG